MAWISCVITEKRVEKVLKRTTKITKGLELRLRKTISNN